MYMHVVHCSSVCVGCGGRFAATEEEYHPPTSAICSSTVGEDRSVPLLWEREDP